MILELLEAPSNFTDVATPKFTGVTIDRISCTSHATIEQQTVHLSITCTYNLDDLVTSATCEILRSKTLYQIKTDGHLNEMELYEVYEQSMVYLIMRLYNDLKSQEIQPKNNLQPLPPQDLIKQMREILHAFENGSSSV